MQVLEKKIKAHQFDGPVYCPLCTHTVRAHIVQLGKQAKVVAGQKCPRCSSSLDAGYVFQQDRAA